MTSGSNTQDSFSLVEEDIAFLPHIFEAYRYDLSNRECWLSIVQQCLRCWRIVAETFYEHIPDTGFQRLGLDQILNQYGTDQLPATPTEDSNVTRHPAITDLSEIIALKLLQTKNDNIVLPFPRVLHKETFTLQHHGIDALGYEVKANGYILYVIEIMASIDGNHPPTVVGEHLTQLLDRTLNVNKAPRLLKDLRTVHDESEATHKDILNGFITVIIEENITDDSSVVATPLLVRRFNEFNPSDWMPFKDKTSEFENAIIPSQICFLAVECHDSFSGMLDLVKQTATTGN